MFSSETASFGRPLRASPSMHISPSFNLANHFSTAVLLVQGLFNVYQAKPTDFFFAKKQCFINARNSFLSIFSQ
jgi:hypothetical protein